MQDLQSLDVVASDCYLAFLRSLSNHWQSSVDGCSMIRDNKAQKEYPLNENYRSLRESAKIDEYSACVGHGFIAPW